MNQQESNHKKETFHSLKPRMPFLQKFIAYYYFHTSKEENYCSTFTYYPHVKNALSIYKNSKIILRGDYHTKTIPDSVDYFFTYTKLTHQFATAEIHAPFDKIGIVFQPLGINHFLKENLSDVVFSQFSLDFPCFQASMAPFLDRIYTRKDLEEKVRLLDEYFLSVYVEFQEKRLEHAMLLLSDPEVKYTVQSLSEKL